nr:MAG TPA: hypothetical protein [Bacteriophage sp.]
MKLPASKWNNHYTYLFYPCPVADSLRNNQLNTYNFLYSQNASKLFSYLQSVLYEIHFNRLIFMHLLPYTLLYIHLLPQAVALKWVDW